MVLRLCGTFVPGITMEGTRVEPEWSMEQKSSSDGKIVERRALPFWSELQKTVQLKKQFQNI